MELEVDYIPNFISKQINDSLYCNFIENLDWESEEVILFNKKFIMERKTCFYGNPGIAYNYSGKKRISKEWPEALLQLKKDVEEKLQCKFNFALLNLYDNGNIALGYHSDNEKDLIKESIIAGISLGTVRDILFKHKITKEVRKINLESGSMIVMKGNTQKNWKHSVPKRTLIKTPRISITFRQIKE